ncbi:putative glycolipid-binding domain-containing protein [Pedobacter agri]|uniref:putative glycolipid-binding domain-containing protein n=1 Tax=Pedobacter agri TaxID=454586 RepID=UPI00292DD658|nr:putative glycolipid-binding domain-containing protein [Pedobacter agri]
MKTIIWKGIYYNALEYFQLSETPHNFTVKSRIIGTFEDKFYGVDYSLVITKYWTLTSFEIEFEVNDNKKRIVGEKNNSDWSINGETKPLLRNFDFIDISLTPFTNTLPINHLHFSAHQKKTIEVMYVDILKGSIEAVKQKYSKNSDLNYHYENIPKDFEADLDVDDSGFVNLYPTLFERIV